jgi:cell division protein FtsL
MVVAGKKGQNTRREVRIRISRPISTLLSANTVTASQSHGSREHISNDFLRLLTRLLLTAGIIVLVLSQLLHWRISKEIAELERVTTINADVRQEHAKLTTQRDELASKPRIVASAAAKLGLHLPTKEQEHQLD